MKLRKKTSTRNPKEPISKSILQARKIIYEDICNEIVHKKIKAGESRKDKYVILEKVYKHYCGLYTWLSNNVIRNLLYQKSRYQIKSNVEILEHEAIRSLINLSSNSNRNSYPPSEINLDVSVDVSTLSSPSFSNRSLSSETTKEIEPSTGSSENRKNEKKNIHNV